MQSGRCLFVCLFNNWRVELGVILDLHKCLSILYILANTSYPSTYHARYYRSL